MSKQFNPLLYTTGVTEDTGKLDKYLELINSAKNAKEKQAVKEEAAKEGIDIRDNGAFIAQAERQCVNARVQGGAASMSKRAMIAVYNDTILKNLGFKLVNAVHDELIGEVPVEHSEEAAKRLTQLMIDSAKPECKTPMKCDTDCYYAWYEDVYSAELKEYNEKLINSGMTEQEAFNQLVKEKSECTEDQLHYLLSR